MRHRALSRWLALAAILLNCATLQLHAQGSNPAQEPPPFPVLDEGDETLEPSVTIKERGRLTVYEYRLNGLLYAVKVIPKNAPAYYLVDSDGDGFMETQHRDLNSPEVNRIPAWVLFRW